MNKKLSDFYNEIELKKLAFKEKYSIDCNNDKKFYEAIVKVDDIYLIEITIFQHSLIFELIKEINASIHNDDYMSNNYLYKTIDKKRIELNINEYNKLSNNIVI
jgi:hypothetical protein